MSLNSESKAPSWIGPCLLLLAIGPFIAAAGYGFVEFDDGLYVFDNQLIQQGLTIEGVKYAFTTFYGGNWHPVTWLAHMLDCTIFGMRPGWHHLVNIVFHAVNTLLLWRLLLRMTGAAWRSALVAALFAVHPLHVESVAWISERKDVLSMLFGLLAIGRYLDFIERRERNSYVWMMVCFVLSLMCKPMFVTLPCVLLLLDIWPLRRWRPWTVEVERSPSEAVVAQPAGMRTLIVEKLPLFAVSAAFSLLAVASQSAAHAMSSADVLPLHARLANTVVAYGAYLSKTAWPVNLAVFYPHPRHWPAAQVAVSACVLVMLSIAAIASRKRAPAILIGWLIFLGTLVPVIGLLQVGVQAYADRYMYLPSVGVFVMIAWALPSPTSLSARRVIAAASVAAVLALAVVAGLQVRYWSDSRVLFEHTLAVTSRNFMAHHCLGVALEKRGMDDEAMAQFVKSAQINPVFAPVRISIGNMLIKRNQLDEAMKQFEDALRLTPYSDTAANSKAVVLLTQGRNAEAEAVLRRAVEVNAANLEAIGNLGTALARQQKWAQAIGPLQRAAKFHPERVIMRTNLAVALANVGRRDEAIAELQDVLRIRPDLAMAQQVLDQLRSPQPPTARP